MRPVKRSALLLVLPILFAGVGVGLARLLLPEATAEQALESTALTRPHHERGGLRVEPAAAPPSPVPRPAPVAASAQEERLQMLERRLEALSARSGDTPPPAPPRPSLEEARRQLFEQHQARLDRHSREPLDATWSHEARGSFSVDLAALTRGQSFTARSIDCRSTTCVITVEWSSYAEATGSYPLLLQHAYGMDCMRSILLPEPADPTARYQASLFLDCGNLR